MGHMAAKIQELRPKAADSEKITINLGFVDLGHIDLLVQEGFYSNRTDFIRAAIRNQLDRHNDAVKQVVPDTSSTSACVGTAGRISRPCARPARRSTSRCSGSPSSPRTSLPGIVPRDVEIAEAAAAVERLCSLCGLGKMII